MGVCVCLIVQTTDRNWWSVLLTTNQMSHNNIREKPVYGIAATDGTKRHLDNTKIHVLSTTFNGTLLKSLVP